MCYTTLRQSDSGCGHSYPLGEPCSERREYDPLCRAEEQSQGIHVMHEHAYWCPRWLVKHVCKELLSLQTERGRERAAAKRARALADHFAGADADDAGLMAGYKADG